MMKRLLIVLVLLGCSIAAFAQATAKSFAGTYNVYGMSGEVVTDKHIAYVTYEKDGTLVFMLNNITPSRGKYTFKKISGNSSYPNAKNPYIYELYCDYDSGQTVVLRLKEVDEDIIPGFRKTSNKRSYITIDPQYIEGNEVYLIFIKQ